MVKDSAILEDRGREFEFGDVLGRCWLYHVADVWVVLRIVRHGFVPELLADTLLRAHVGIPEKVPEVNIVLCESASGLVGIHLPRSVEQAAS